MSNESTDKVKPLVSAVIPTRNRPELVIRAVTSALKQTFENLEVIVVIDGPDRRTVDALSGIGDARLRWIELPESGGGNRARNCGASVAKGDWIAFLDDDDEWMPTKTECQLACVSNAGEELTVVSCRFIARGTMGDPIWPQRLPKQGEPIGDYLFCRHSFFNGSAAVITSTLMLSKRLFEAIRFSENVKRHQEADLLLRAAELPLNIVFAPEPLVVWYNDEKRTSITNTNDWQQSLLWLRSHRTRLSRSAYSGFVLVSLSAEARRERAWGALIPILREAITSGIPTFRHLLLFFAIWLVPKDARQRLRLKFGGNSKLYTKCSANPSVRS